MYLTKCYKNMVKEGCCRVRMTTMFHRLALPAAANLNSLTAVIVIAPAARYALSPHATVIFFWSFYIVVLFILLNMFISIIMEAAEEVTCDSPPTFHPLKPPPIFLRSKTVS